MKQPLSNDTEAYDSFRDWARKAQNVLALKEKADRLREQSAEADSEERMARAAEESAWKKIAWLRADHTGITP